MFQLKSGYLNLFFALVVLSLFTATRATFASIIPTNVSFDPPFRGYGSYTQINESLADILGEFGVSPNYVVARSELSANLLPNMIEISGSADGGGYFTPDFQERFAGASATGSVSFEVDKGNSYDLIWNAGGSAAEWNIGFNPYLKINSAQGDVVAACGATLGCDQYPLVDPDFPEPLVTNGSPELRFALPAGTYTMYFSVSTDHGAGVTVPADFSLTLREVPLPSGVWLLIGGLGIIQRRIILRMLGKLMSRYSNAKSTRLGGIIRSFMLRSLSPKAQQVVVCPAEFYNQTAKLT